MPFIPCFNSYDPILPGELADTDPDYRDIIAKHDETDADRFQLETERETTQLERETMDAKARAWIRCQLRSDPDGYFGSHDEMVALYGAAFVESAINEGRE